MVIYREVDGQVLVDWPDPEPDSYEVYPDLLHLLVDNENQRRQLVSEVEDLTKLCAALIAVLPDDVRAPFIAELKEKAERER